MTNRLGLYKLMPLVALGLAVILCSCIARPVDREYPARGASNENGAYVGFGAGVNH